MEEIEVLATGDVKVADGRYPSRVVLRKMPGGPFATHIEVLPPGGEPYFILGNYFFSLEDARSNFHKRIGELENG